MKTLRLLLVLGLAHAIIGCHNEDSNKPVVGCEVTSTCPQPTVKLSGTAAIGVAIPDGIIEVFDGNDNKLDATATTDASGNFVLQFSGTLPSPIRIAVTNSDGETLSTIVDDSDATVANINPVTNYVTDSLLQNSSLDELTTGDVEAAGQEVVESLLGEGADFGAFSTAPFVAKTSTNDFSTQASAADVLLDSIAQAAVGQDVADLIDNTVKSETTLLASPEFVVSVASNIAMIEGDSVNLEDVFDVDNTPAAVTNQLTDVKVFQQTAETVINDVAQTEGLDDEEKAATASGMLEIIADAAIQQEDIEQSDIEAISQNVVENLLQDLIRVVTSPDAQQLSSEELLAAISNTAEQIADAINDNGVDLTNKNADLNTVKEEVANVDIVIENTTDWGNAKWDKLVWQ